MKNNKEIISNAKAVTEWMKKFGWYEEKKCPDSIAAAFSGGFNELLIKLCDSVLEAEKS